LFGGIALAAISYFILIKGLKEVSFIASETKDWINTHELLLLAGSFVFFTLLSFIVIRLGFHIFKLIIIIGTFALALSFAGNDLVNFIGVPVAAYQSVEIFMQAPVADPSTFMMGSLADDNITAPIWILM